MSSAGNGAGGIADRELRVCTVRIDVQGAPAGSGFFVVPGHVVTCEHVLNGATDGIEVSDVDGVEYSVVKVADVSKDADLAVLQVKPANEHRCVLLIGGQNFDDRFLTFGYPEHRREGVASPLVAEGNTGDERLLKLGQGQIQPGMSGAPVLNRRTGGVCGVLSMTRDDQSDLGGYAVPIERLWLLSSTLKRQNEAYHEAHRDEWFDRLPMIQKRVLLDARPGALASEGFTMWYVVSVGGEQRRWWVSATEYPSGQRFPPAKPAELHLVVDQAARLFRDWAARARVSPIGAIRRQFNQAEAIRLLGGILFDAVLPDEIGKRFDELVSSGNERVQLALHFDRTVIPPDLVDMPWEYLYVGDERGFRRDAQIAAEEKLAFVRVESSDFREPDPPTRRDLSALMVPVTPPSEDGDAAADEIAAAACGVVEALGGFGVKTLRMPRAMDLRNELVSDNADYDIVHYVGFGRYLQAADRLALAGSPEYDFRDAQMFANLFPERAQRREGERPRVVVLQQIDGPGDFVPPDLSGFAWRLLARGVDAVVAYQFPLSARLGKAFNKEFYTRVAAGEAFEAAVQKARALIWTMEPDLHAFLAPAAFVSQPGELRLTAAAGPSAPLSRAGVTAAQAQARAYERYS